MDQNDKDRIILELLLSTQTAIHEALLDSFDTVSAMLVLLNMISETNIYMRIPNSIPSLFILRKIARYVTFILRIFGVIQTNDSFGFKDIDEFVIENSKEKVISPYVETMIAFRSQIRNAALSFHNKNDPIIETILSACDKLRDDALIRIGVRLSDISTDSKWSLDDPQILYNEYKDRLKREHEILKAKNLNKLEALYKEIWKTSDAMIEPKDLFQNKSYSDWTIEGLPTKLANGDELSKAQMKNNKKKFDKHVIENKQLFAKTKGDPKSFLNTLVDECTRLVSELSTQL